MYNTFCYYLISLKLIIFKPGGKNLLAYKTEIKDIDMLTRKILTMKRSFHKASDINRLNVDRKKGGQGIQCIEDLYGYRIINLQVHLEQAAQNHSLLGIVKIHE